MLNDHHSSNERLTTINDTIDLGRIVALMFRRWWVFAIFGCLGLLLGGFALTQMTPKYEAYVVIAPAENSSRLHRELNGVSVTGGSALEAITGNKSHTSNFDKFLHLLRSVEISEILRDTTDFYQVIFSSSWDPEQKIWREPQDQVQQIKGYIKSLIGRPRWQEPNPTFMSLYLDQSLPSRDIGKTGLVRISYRHQDPEFAFRFIDGIYHIADNLLKEKEFAKASDDISYLEQKLSQVSNKYHRDTLVSILSSYEMQMMSIQSHAPLGADLIEGPFVSDVPVTPRVSLVLAISLFIGLILGGVVALMMRVK